MKTVLYFSNIEVPYRNKFFNQLSKFVDLTILYEKRSAKSRNLDWCSSIERRYKVKYIYTNHWPKSLIKIINIFKTIILKKYDYIIIGCYNTPWQMFTILLLRFFKKSYIINLDGEQFFSKSFSFKNVLKSYFLKGANRYLIAGIHSAENLKSCSFIDPSRVISYNFSSLTNEEIKTNSSKIRINKNNKVVLVVGRYYPYKGLDVAVKVARKDKSIQYVFVGMGDRSKNFENDFCLYNDQNIKVIPFLQQSDLEQLYLSADAFLLPSRKECWGLVINQAASYGLPIVSTDGSGAAIDFISDAYSKYIAQNSNAEDIYNKLCDVFNANSDYSDYLIKRSAEYSIESMVETHIHLFMNGI